MAGRDPNKPQLDFPQLTADIIRQLRLTGQLGLLDFSDQVAPVYIVAAREGALEFEATSPAFASAAISSANVITPALNSVIVDTGPLPAGVYDIFASGSATGNMSINGEYALQHRNAANAATLATLLSMSLFGTTQFINMTLAPMGYTLALNERLRWFMEAANTGSNSGTIAVLRRPTP